MRYDVHLYFNDGIYCGGIPLSCLERCEKMGLDNDCHDNRSDDLTNF